jgi:hypothetical protein
VIGATDRPGSIAGSGSAKTIKAIAVKSGMSDSAVASTTISVRDLYMVGNNNNGWGKWTPFIWENGTVTDLSQGAGGADAYAMGFSGSDIYVAGDWSGDTYWKPGYWENDICTPLTGTNSLAKGIAIAANGSECLVGYMEDGSVQQPYSWIVTSSASSGTPTALSMLDAAKGGSATAIAMSSGSVYIVGTVVSSSGVTMPCYWKDGARVDLSPKRSFGGKAAALTFADGVLYIAGYTKDSASEGEVPCYWKVAASTTRVDLPVRQPRGTTSGIAVSGGTVYVTGGYGSQIDTWPAYPISCFWRDGAQIDIPKGSYYAGMPTACVFGN